MMPRLRDIAQTFLYSIIGVLIWAAVMVGLTAAWRAARQLLT